MSSNREVKAIITADASNFEKGVGKASQSSSALEKALSKLGPVGNMLQGVLSKVGLSSVSMGTGLVGAGVVAVGAAVAAGEKAISTYVELADKVRDYSIKTGESAEASSRQVQAFAELGVGEDVASAGMVKLSKAIETTPKKLENLGVAIAKDSSGNVDLGKTLLNVAAAWQSTTDAAKRNEIVLTAFGKAGASMIPILEANASELARLEAQVQTVYTAEDLKKVRDYQIAQKELNRSTTDLWNSIGQKLLPIQAALVDSTNENIFVSEHLDEQLAKLGATHSQNRAAIMLASEALRQEYRASQDAQSQADSLANSQQSAAQAAQAEADAENKLYDELHKATDASFAYEQAVFDLKTAQDNYNKAGGQTAENNLRLREAYVKVADAAVAQAEAQAEANGTTLSASEKADIYRASLGQLAASLDPNSPLRKQLQAYIDQLNAIPSSKTTVIGQSYRAGTPGGKGGSMSFDEGGIVPGPTGAPVPAVVHGGEAVFTPKQLKTLAVRGGNTYNLTLVGAAAVNDPEGVRRMLMRMQYLGGNS